MNIKHEHPSVFCKAKQYYFNGFKILAMLL